jgi:cell division septation protein DedD
MQRAWPLFALVLALTAPGRSARADSGAPAGAAAVVDALPVLCKLDKTTLNAEQLRVAIEQELRVRVKSVDVLDGGGLSIAVVRRQARISFTTPAGHTTTRSVSLSGDDKRSSEIVALLAGNLARDQASELLAGLAPVEPAPSTEAAAEPEPDAQPPAEPEPEAKPAAEKKAEPAKSAAKPAPKKRAAPGDGLLRDSEAAINLSLYHPITLQSESERRLLRLEFGAAYSRVGAIEGFALTFGYLRVTHHVNGVVTAIGLARVDGNVEGFQTAGLISEGHGRLRGYESANLLALRWGDVMGAQTAVLGTLARDVEGFQGAAGVSVARDVDGVQAAVVTVGRDLEGAQLGIVNTSREVRGFQMAVVNVARRADVQIGLVNIAEEVDVGAWGLVTIAGNGRVQPTFWTTLDSAWAVNAGARFVAGYGFSQLGAGLYPDGKHLRTEAGGGAHVPLAGPLFVEIGAHVSTRFQGELTMAASEQHRLHYRAGAGLDFDGVSFFAAYDLSHDVSDFGTDLRAASPVAGISLF